MALCGNEKHGWSTNGTGACGLAHTPCVGWTEGRKRREGRWGLACFFCKNDASYEVIGGIWCWGDGTSRPVSCWWYALGTLAPTLREEV